MDKLHLDLMDTVKAGDCLTCPSLHDDNKTHKRSLEIFLLDESTL